MPSCGRRQISLGWCWKRHADEAELAQYCRGKGLFVEQRLPWRRLASRPMALAERNRNCASEGKADAKRIRIEEGFAAQEGTGKATALIILRKKAQAIWEAGAN